MPSVTKAPEIDVKEEQEVAPENSATKRSRLSTILAFLREMPGSSRVSETIRNDQLETCIEMLTQDPFISLGSCSG